MNLKLTISNVLIGLSICFTLISFFNKDILIYGLNNYFLLKGDYLNLILQFPISNFIHGGLVHLLLNSFFIYYFGNIVEENIGKNKYIIFFLSNMIFTGISILYFSSGNTIGISGFALALLTYYTLLLKQKNNPEYKGGITAIVINILLGLSSGISFIGHLFGAIFGVLYFIIIKLSRNFVSH